MNEKQNYEKIQHTETDEMLFVCPKCTHCIAAQQTETDPLISTRLVERTRRERKHLWSRRIETIFMNNLNVDEMRCGARSP